MEHDAIQESIRNGEAVIVKGKKIEVKLDEFNLGMVRYLIIIRIR